MVWILFWVVTFSLIDFLRKKGISHSEKWVWVAAVFLVFTFLAITYFRNVLPVVDISSLKAPLLTIVIVFLLTFLMYYLCRRFLKKPVKLIKNNPASYFIKMDYRYLLCKPFDLLFQQVLILVGVLWLTQRGLSLWGVIAYFIFLFGLLHFIWIKRAGKLFGRYFFISSLVGAIIFPILILKVEGGFIYSYLAHFLFYTLSALFFWVFARE